ncbi:MAG: NADH-quinone oxidoreductase subunit C [Actinomycetota bacterium]
MDAQALADRLRDRFPDLQVARGEVTVIVDPEEVVAALTWLRDEPGLELGWLADLSATDWPEYEPRFWIAYHLFSMARGHRVRVKAGLGPVEPRIATVSGEFPTANWLEREVYDMYGVVFDGHPDLRRILMPDDWDGHPLRKDYALGGVGTQYKGAFIPPVDERSV